MAKLLLIFALCLSTTLAVPNLKFSRSHLALTRVASQLKSVDAGFETCLQLMISIIYDALLVHFDQLQNCTHVLVQEVQAIEEEIAQTTELTTIDFQAKVRVFEACGSDEACRAAAMKDIVEVIAGYIQDVNEISNRHETSLLEKFPEAAKCIDNDNLALVDAIKTAGSNFVACVTEGNSV